MCVATIWGDESKREKLSAHVKDLKPESEKVMRNDMGSGFEKIKWNDSDARLVYLWELLINEGLLSKEYSQLGNRRFALLASHFQREDGTPFVNKNLAKIRDRIINKNKSKKPREPEKIEKVINETKLKKLD